VNVAYSVVLITKDRPTHAAAAVAALLRQHRLPARIVVVDADSEPLALPPETAARADELGVDIRLIHARPNTGTQRNIGVEQVETEVTFFLDDDAWVPDDYVDVLLRRWEEIGFERIGGALGSRDVVVGGHMNSIRGLLGFSIESDDGGPRLRRSGKLIHVPNPRREVYADAVSTTATLYRTDLLRRFPFEERFSGYVLGEDIDISYRVARVAPILISPDVYWTHPKAEGGRDAVRLWYARSRHDAFFRWRRIEKTPGAVAAYAWSVVAETLVAAAVSARRRDRRPLEAYLRGFHDWRHDVRSGIPSDAPPARPPLGIPLPTSGPASDAARP
jgi:GT2 family glycosyltransferase